MAAESSYLLAHLFLNPPVSGLGQHPLYKQGDASRLFSTETAGGDGGSANPDATGDGRRPGIERDHIFIDNDVYALQGPLSHLPGNAPRGQVNEKEMDIGAAGYQVQAISLEFPGHNLGIP